MGATLVQTVAVRPERKYVFSITDIEAVSGNAQYPLSGSKVKMILPSSPVGLKVSFVIPGPDQFPGIPD